MRLNLNNEEVLPAFEEAIPPQIELRASKGIVKKSHNLTTNPDKGRNPPNDYSIFLEMMQNDPVISTALDTVVDVCTKNGYSFIGPVNPAKEAKIKFEEQLNFDEIIDSVIYSLQLYGDAYIEKRRKSGVITELNPLETTEIKIKYTDKGEITGFIQNEDSAEEVFWEPKEVCYFRMKRIGSQVYSYSPFEPVATTFATSAYAHDYVLKIFKNLPPKLLWILKNANKEQRKTFITNLRVSKTNPHIDLVAIGEADVKNTIVNFKQAGIFELLEYMREQVLMVTRVPPVWVGIVNDSGANRGNAEAQITSFETHIGKIQQKVEHIINTQLLTDLGFKKLKFKFNTALLRSEKEVLENAERLRNIGYDVETVNEYVKSKGIGLKAGAKIEQEQTKNKDLMPSRRREDKAVDNMTSNVDSKGVSAEGKKVADNKAAKAR